MTKDVLISISGLQYEIYENEPIEVISPGEYYYKNGKHYIIYEELTEEDSLEAGITKCILKISDLQISLTKKGAANVQMLFEESKNHMTFYNTNYGDFLININTTDISIKDTPDLITVELSYNLDLNYQHVSECQMTIKIASHGQTSALL